MGVAREAIWAIGIASVLLPRVQPRPGPRRKPERSVREFVVGLAAAAIVALGALLLAFPVGADGSIAAGVFALGLGIFVLQRSGIVVRWRSQRIFIDFEEAALVLGFVLLPGPAVALATVGGVALVQLVARRSRLKAAFNVGAHALGVSLAAGTFALLASHLAIPAAGLAVLVSVGHAVVTNLLVAAVFALHERAEFTRVVRERLLLPTLAQTALGACVGLLAVALWLWHPVTLVILLPLLVLLRHYVILAEISDRELATHERLARMARAMAGATDRKIIVEEALAAVGDVLAPGRVALVVDGRSEERRHEGGARPGRGAITVQLPSSPGAPPGTLTAWPSQRTGRSFHKHDLQVLHVVAAQVAAGLANAHLRETGVAAEARAHRLAELAARLSWRARGETTVSTILDGTVRVLGASDGIVYLADPVTAQLTAVAWQGYSDAQVEPLRHLDPKAPLPLADALDEGPIFIEGRPALAARYPRLAETSPDRAAWAALPLVVGERLIGALGVTFSRPVSFTEEEREFAVAVAGYSAVAIESARLDAAEREARAEAARSVEAREAIERVQREVLENVPAGILYLDANGVITYENRPLLRILGAPEDEKPRGWNRRILDLETVRAHPEFVDKLESLLKGEAFRDFEIDYRSLYERRRALSISGVPLTERDGTPRGAILFIRDVDAERRAEQELAAARRSLFESEKLSALGSLVSGVAHEVRTPLTYILNNLEATKRQVVALQQDPRSFAPAEARRLLEKTEAALEGTERINRLVGELRRFTRRTGDRVRSSLPDVVSEAVALFVATHPEGPRVLVDFRRAPVVEVDRLQVQQVVLNLLQNAAEAGPAKKRVTVATREAEGKAELSVSDDGPGIPPSVRERMFDPFFTTKADGTGLGLAITRRIVEAHGATILCESEVGVGTRFTVRFPPSTS